MTVNQYLVLSGAVPNSINGESVGTGRVSLDSTKHIVKTTRYRCYSDDAKAEATIVAGPLDQDEMRQYIKDNSAEWEAAVA